MHCVFLRGDYTIQECSRLTWSKNFFFLIYIDIYKALQFQKPSNFSLEKIQTRATNTTEAIKKKINI